MMIQHQFVERETGATITENLIGDRALGLLYNRARENAPLLFSALTGPRASRILAAWHFDNPLDRANIRANGLVENINTVECLDDPENLDTPRKIFERKIKYWDCRPMDDSPEAIVSPADAKTLVGSFLDTSQLFLKGKFFDLDELLSTDRNNWREAFSDGDFAVFRLTPDKYHYNHTPVSGTVLDIYEIQGAYHSCNPSAIVSYITPLSKNKRVVTILDTDVEGGARIGLVAMIEIVALMIGDIVQAYSDTEYNDPRRVQPGMKLLKGRPKSLYRPGSSTDVLLFEKGRIRFSEDIVSNQKRKGIQSRYSQGFGCSLVETDLKVRSTIAMASK